VPIILVTKQKKEKEMKNLTAELTSLKINEEILVACTTMAANKVIGIVTLLQEQAGLSYLVGGNNGQILIRRVK
jgi:hypothetical protein